MRERKELQEVKRGVLFGLIIGWLMTLVSAFHYFFQLDGKAWLWGCCAGTALLTMTVIFPQVVGMLQEAIQVVAGFVASQVLKLVCVVIYFTVVLPIGLLSQRTRGTHPFYEWDNVAPANAEGWVDKKITADSHSRKNIGLASAVTQPVFLVQAVRHRCSREIHFLREPRPGSMPSVLAIFAESSVMAPLIYTLF